MIQFNPVWAISEYGFQLFQSGMADFIARAADARVRTEQSPLMTMAGDTAVIDVQGVMQKRESLWTAIGLATSTETVAKAVDAATADSKTRSIILRIDSPGGNVDGQYRLVESVRQANAVKPVFAQVDGMAASAGYWLASQARRVYAGPGDEVGSIGVRLMLYDFSRMFEMAGVEAVAVDSGKYKSAGAYGTEITEEHRAYFQSMVDSYFADFLGDVKAGRRMSQARATEVGDGRMFTAKQAVENGLIDGIQTLDATLRTAKRATGRATDSAKARARLRERMQI